MRHFKVNFIFSKFQKKFQKKSKKTIDMTASYVIVRGVIKNIKNIKNIKTKELYNEGISKRIRRYRRKEHSSRI